MMKNGLTLYIANLNYSVEIDDLKKLLNPFGKVAWVKLVMKEDGKKSGIAFAYMPNGDQAKMAIKKLDGLAYQGRTLKVSIAQENGKNTPKGQQRFTEEEAVAPKQKKERAPVARAEKSKGKGLDALFSYLNKKK